MISEVKFYLLHSTTTHDFIQQVFESHHLTDRFKMANATTATKHIRVPPLLLIWNQLDLESTEFSSNAISPRRLDPKKMMTVCWQTFFLFYFFPSSFS